MEEKNRNQELEQMRQQFDMLKAHLDERRQLKEKQVKAAIKSDVRWRIRLMWISVVMFAVAGFCGVMAMLSPADHKIDNVPYIIIALMFLGIGFCVYQGRKLKRLEHHAECNMIEAQKELLKYKKSLSVTWWKGLLIYIVAFICGHIVLSLIAGKSFNEIVAPTADQIISYSVAWIIALPVMFVSQKMNKNKFDSLLQQIDELDKMNEK